MLSNSARQPAVRLSICITTLNRAGFFGATLESIIPQLTSECELVVLDAGSTDGTEALVSEYARRCRLLRYVKQKENNGFDRDCDRVIELARGEYCWLMTDDDLLRPNAVSAILNNLRPDISLVVINTEVRDLELSKVLQRRWPDFEADRVYAPGEMDRLFVETGGALNCNAFVLKREIWLAREKEKYVGSLMLYMAVIFQQQLPGKTLVMAEPLILHRMGNTHTYSPIYSELLLAKWPSVVEAMPLSVSARQRIPTAEPWHHLRMLMLLRARGYYSIAEYRRWVRPRLKSGRRALAAALVAMLPGTPLNTALLLYYAVTRRRYAGLWQPEFMVYRLKDSPFYMPNQLLLLRR